MRHKSDIWDDATLQECCKFPRYSALIVQLLIKKCHYSYHLMNQCLSIIALTPPIHTCCFSLFFIPERSTEVWKCFDMLHCDPGITFFRGKRSTVPLCPDMDGYSRERVAGIWFVSRYVSIYPFYVRTFCRIDLLHRNLVFVHRDLRLFFLVVTHFKV
jgi:hypothetical protein